jgi:hypothetical protein
MDSRFYSDPIFLFYQEVSGAGNFDLADVMQLPKDVGQLPSLVPTKKEEEPEIILSTSRSDPMSYDAFSERANTSLPSVITPKAMHATNRLLGTIQQQVKAKLDYKHIFFADRDVKTIFVSMVAYYMRFLDHADWRSRKSLMTLSYKIKKLAFDPYTDMVVLTDTSTLSKDLMKVTQRALPY